MINTKDNLLNNKGVFLFDAVALMRPLPEDIMMLYEYLRNDPRKVWSCVRYSNGKGMELTA